MSVPTCVLVCVHDVWCMGISPEELHFHLHLPVDGVGKGTHSVLGEGKLPV